MLDFQIFLFLPKHSLTFHETYLVYSLKTMIVHRYHMCITILCIWIISCQYNVFQQNVAIKKSGSFFEKNTALLRVAIIYIQYVGCSVEHLLLQWHRQESYFVLLCSILKPSTLLYLRHWEILGTNTEY